MVLRYYPVASIRDLNIVASGKTFQSPWDYPFVLAGSDTLSLNDIEHNIIRARYKEPRIHFVLVCAAESCPVLLNKAYLGPVLDQQLEEQTKRFILDKTRNNFAKEPAQVSSLFEWYAADFGDLGAFLSKYTQVPISRPLKLQYMPYSWKLNE